MIISVWHQLNAFAPIDSADGFTCLLDYINFPLIVVRLHSVQRENNLHFFSHDSLSNSCGIALQIPSGLLKFHSGVYTRVAGMSS